MAHKKKIDKRNAEERAVDLFEQLRPYIHDGVEATYCDEMLKKYSPDDKMGFGILAILEKLAEVTGTEKKKLISILLWRLFTTMYKEEAEIRLQQNKEAVAQGSIKRIK